MDGQESREAVRHWTLSERVEWNPTEDVWIPGTVTRPYPVATRVGITLDDGAQFLWVMPSNLRSEEKAV